MPEVTILGINFWIFFIITVFFCVVAILSFGPSALGDPGITMIIVFLTLGIALLIGHFGWAILVIPSILILVGTAYLLKRLS